MHSPTFSRYSIRFCAVTAIVLSTILFASGSTIAAELANPLGPGATDPNVIIARIIKSVLGIVGVIALLVMIYGGFEMLTSGGNEERVERGRDAILWAVIGLVVIFGSYGIIQAIFLIIGGESVI